MSIPLYLVLILAGWVAALIYARHDFRNGGWFSGVGALIACLLAVVWTLGLALVHEWGWI